jgi:hypothetical protein
LLKKLFYILILIYSVSAFSETKYVLEGTIGKSEIYLYFEDYSTPKENQIGNVRYFYKNSLKDIVMNGSKLGNKFTFTVRDYDNDSFLEKFELSLSKDGLFKGFWKNKKGVQIPISLKKFDADVFKTKYSKNRMPHLLNENPFNYIRINFTQFKKDSVSIYKDKTFEWFSEKHCTMPFFRIADGFLESEKNKLNPILNNIHYEEVIAQLECASELEYSKGNGIEYSININYLDNNLLGFNLFKSWFCGGAHPDYGGDGYLLDFHTGKRYEIDEIIAFDKSVTTEELSSHKNFSEYRNNFFAPVLFSILNEIHHFEKPIDEDDEICNYHDLENWNYISWNYTEKGIEFTPYFYRAARHCEEPFLITFHYLRKYKNPAFPYNF